LVFTLDSSTFNQRGVVFLAFVALNHSSKSCGHTDFSSSPLLSSLIFPPTHDLLPTIPLFAMKSAKPPAADSPANRRSQPVRQTRTNPPRSSVGLNRSLNGRDGLTGGHAPDQPIDIFPAITHFADAITALPKELVRHFTLLKEVDAKIFTPEDSLFKLIDAALDAPPPEPRPSHDGTSSIAPASAPMSAQNSSSGIVVSNSLQLVPSVDDSYQAAIYDRNNLHRRQLFRQTAFKIQELLVSLEEKNHVISTANEALQKQMARIEDVWPHLEHEFSDEAKWGSTTHWAYPENRTGRSNQTERSRRDGAAVISAAAQALAEEAAQRSDARKKAVEAKKSLKNQHQDSDFDDHEARKGETGKKGQGNSKVRKTAESTTTNVGLGITTAGAVNGNPPPKRRKVEKPPKAALPTEKAMSTVFGNNAATKPKTVSPRETPVPEPTKKRKALPTGANGQAKKAYVISYECIHSCHYLFDYEANQFSCAGIAMVFQECHLPPHPLLFSAHSPTLNCQVAVHPHQQPRDPSILELDRTQYNRLQRGGNHAQLRRPSRTSLMELSLRHLTWQLRLHGLDRITTQNLRKNLLYRTKWTPRR
jgi:hypothetical protein